MSQTREDLKTCLRRVVEDTPNGNGPIAFTCKLIQATLDRAAPNPWASVVGDSIGILKNSITANANAIASAAFDHFGTPVERGAGIGMVPKLLCECAAIQRADDTRHFRGCPKRAQHPRSKDEERLSAAIREVVLKSGWHPDVPDVDMAELRDAANAFFGVSP